MTPRQIRGFLLKAPKPDKVRMSSADGLPQEIKAGPGRSFSKMAETIAAIAPELVECLDKNDNLIRAMRMTGEESSRSDAALIPPGIQADPEALRMAHFANLIHRAYEHSTEIAFTKLIELVERMDARTESIEQRLERAEASYRRALKDQVDDAFDRADELAEQAEAGDAKEQILNQLVAGVVQGQASANGKGKQ